MHAWTRNVTIIDSLVVPHRTGTGRTCTVSWPVGGTADLCKGSAERMLVFQLLSNKTRDKCYHASMIQAETDEART